MKILQLSTNDLSGGAAKAAFRLHTALKNNGVESYMFVQRKQSNDKTVLGAKSNLFYRGINYLRGKIDHFPKKSYFSRQIVPWSINWLPNPFLIRKIRRIDPDIIHLHWINGGFIPINSLKKILKLKKPIVWTLHDSWTFTGGCHIPHDCKKYEQQCGKCPLLGSNKDYDLSRIIWLKKKKEFDKVNMTFVTPSIWLKNCAKNSSLLKNKKVIIIPNFVDIDKFKNVDKNLARKKLGLSKNKKYLLFGAMSATTDKNKGFDLLLKSLQALKNTKNIELLVFGNKALVEINTKIPIHFFGRINNMKMLNELYSASDVTIVPSKSENFPNIILESFSSGTPCVAFNIGGIPDIIDHKVNGYLAKPFDVKDLAKGIKFCLLEKNLGENARDKMINEYTQKIQVKKYRDLYQELI